MHRNTEQSCGRPQKGTTMRTEAELQEEKRKKQASYELLERLQIPYTVAEHDYADTIEQCHQAEEKLNCRICKNLLLTNRQMTELYLLLMPGDKPFKTKLLSAQIGSSRLSFATPEQMLRHLNITPGSVSVLGLMYDRENAVKLLIDRDLLKNEYLGCHPCINSASVKLRTEDVLRILLPALHHTAVFVDLPAETEENTGK